MELIFDKEIFVKVWIKKVLFRQWEDLLNNQNMVWTLYTLDGVTWAMKTLCEHKMNFWTIIAIFKFKDLILALTTKLDKLQKEPLRWILILFKVLDIGSILSLMNPHLGIVVLKMKTEHKVQFQSLLLCMCCLTCRGRYSPSTWVFLVWSPTCPLGQWTPCLSPTRNGHYQQGLDRRKTGKQRE